MTPDSPVVDLVLLSWNHLEQTRPCLETLFACTRTPSRLIIVDNGSGPETRAFLQTVRPQGAITEVVLLQNEGNEGFPKGMNRGIRASTAPYVCILNNDLRFAPGWLEEMLAVAESDPSIGLINPESNTFGNVPPRGVSLAAYAESLRRRHRAYVEVGMCIGFCVLMPRRAVDALGGFTEEVERIFFEDEDLSIRAQRAGFRSVVAQAAYVHHAEHGTVGKMPEREALFSRNRNWCHTKWGRWVRVAWPRFDEVRAGSPESRRWLEELLECARRRMHVYVYGPMPAGLTPEALFRSVGLVPHADVRWHRLPPAAVRWTAMGGILKKRKKRFDIIVAPDPGWGRVAAQLNPLHRARVVPEGDQHGMLQAWEASRFPSSS